jgi:transaldolase
MKNNPLQRLGALGQSPWLDYVRRDLITGGGLRRFIEVDGLRGVTSNPSIFQKAIAESHFYDPDISRLTAEGRSVEAIYDALSQHDVQSAADLFGPVYDAMEGRDGYVSLEVDPRLARNTPRSLEEARRLWSSLNRPNIMIKVPGTLEGVPAIRQLIEEGINVNVTLLFGLARYRQVAEAYLAGLEARTAQGKPVNHVASVASFFVSRIDSHIDPALAKLSRSGGAKADIAKRAEGQVAIANAKRAYQVYKEIFGSPRFERLRAEGARPQRLLWASTSTKNPSYDELKYVEALIAPETVDTLPLDTLNAYRERGNPEVRIERDLAEAERVLATLPELGIDLDRVTDELEDEGIQKFSQPFDQLLAALAPKTASVAARRA